MKLPYRLFLLCVTTLLILSNNVQAQKKLLKEVQMDLPKDKHLQEVIKNQQNRSKKGSLKFYTFDKEILNDASIEVETPDGESYVFLLDELDARGKEDFTWHGHIQGNTGGYAVIVFLKGQIAGDLVIGSKKYGISPLTENIISVYEIDNAKFPEDHPNLKESLVPSSNSTTDLSTADNLVCRVRVLVGYTNQAKSGAAGMGYSDMNLFVQQAISESNQGFINSAISHRMELAVSVNVTYTESGDYDTDLGRFRGTSDGYMDNIHTYRSLYGADLCALIFNNSAYCGLAYTINAVASDAFCVIHYSCALGNYSFGHELGHLYGARHNPEADGTTTPYAYGHGKCYTPGNWRTVMSYSCSGETRINYWSNPSILYGGVATGDVSTRNNARVLNDRDGVVAAFVATPTTITIGSNGLIRQYEIGDALASSQVVLSSGFTAANGSNLHVYTGACSGGFKISQTNNSGISTGQADESATSHIDVFPNPSNGSLNLHLTYSAQKNVSISILDIMGKEIYKENLGAVSDATVPLNIQNLSEGIYLIKLDSGDEIQTRQIVIRK